VKVLVLGVTGMLGRAVFRHFFDSKEHEVCGTYRGLKDDDSFIEKQKEYMLEGVDVLDSDALVGALSKFQPDVVINCVGLIKQQDTARDPLIVLPMNTLFPHKLEKLCALIGARLIHISTDCVFSGNRGGYLEEDFSDAEDLYGKSKFLGELNHLQHVVTLRTSIIGHELNSCRSLIDWFLSQEGRSVKGFTKAVFSGLPTVELARVIAEYVLPKPELFGLYHVSVDPIDKFSLLTLVADIYGKEIEILPSEELRIDRSLNSDRFKKDFGYTPPSWPELIKMMHSFRLN